MLPMGPGQRNLPEEEGAAILRAAADGGVTFFDTAKGYGTQSWLRRAFGEGGRDLVVATKTPAADEAGAAADVEQAVRETGRGAIDLFHLHAARDPDPFVNRAGALRRLLRCKAEGTIRTVGISTHRVSVVRAAARRDDIDVVFPLVNLTGMGILDGTANDMAAAIREAAEAGLGVYAMKPLAGGHLLPRFREAMEYVRRLEGISAVAVGVVSRAELDFHLRLFGGEMLADKDYAGTARIPKRYIVLPGCTGCGICRDECPAEAIAIADGKARVIEKKCILCGYCANACPEFWIRTV
jgi:predicted aldo/keto reductase-like oxidoreductase